MDIETRIAQFEKMAHDDPDNDMAHFSLGGAYQQAGRFEEAAESYLRCVELNPGMSKAYQLAGAALIAVAMIAMIIAVVLAVDISESRTIRQPSVR